MRTEDAMDGITSPAPLTVRGYWLSILEMPQEVDGALNTIAEVSIPPISLMYLLGQRFALYGAGSDEDHPEFARGYADMQAAMERRGVTETDPIWTSSEAAARYARTAFPKDSRARRENMA